MKSVLLYAAFFLAVIGVSNKPRFRYLNKKIPIYISISKNMADTSLLVSLRDTLTKTGFEIVSAEVYRKLTNEFLKNLGEYPKNHPVTKTENFERDWTNMMQDAWTKTYPASQQLAIFLRDKDIAASLETCDSIGFSYYKKPLDHFDLHNPQATRVYQTWNMKEIGSRSADSVLSFLFNKL